MMLEGPMHNPTGGRPAESLVVFLHGYGADGHDLIDIAKYWADDLPRTHFIAPHAPHPCGMSPMGREWFPLMQRTPDEFWTGVEQAAPALNKAIDHWLEKFSIPANRLALVGFSQGTMMALHVGLRRKHAPACIVGYSGVLAGAEQPLPLQEGKTPCLFLAHGTHDPVIPAAALVASCMALHAQEKPVVWHLDPGAGHTITSEGIERAKAWLVSSLMG